MNPDLEVDAEGLRRAATAVHEVATRVTGAGGAVPAPDPAPRWATTTAAVQAADAAGSLLRQLGEEVSGTAGRIRAAAAAYEDADHRAAGRFRQTR
ncbi:type VII secretion target [Actinoplanes sp. NPDC049802]|uniref:type VII secretion target n=1 Tax=Actinoplanes sp. NPDC049802 TaxID=3154742 RepID=UPI0033D2C8C9